MHMIWACLAWWYRQGWRHQLQIVSERNAKLADLFSLGLLLRTMFAPFRQIGTGAVRGSLDVRFHAWADLLFSRIVGSVVRFFTLLTGCIAIVVVAALGAVQLVLWAALPFLPIIGIFLAGIGWAPWQS